MLVLFLTFVLFARLGWLFYFEKSTPLAFLIPMALELLFIYPFFALDLLGLKWSFYGLFTMFLFVFSLQVGMVLTYKSHVSILHGRVNNQIYPFILLSLLFVFFSVLSNQSNLLLLISNPALLFEFANQNAISRYSGGLQVSLIYKVSVIVSFLLGFLLGVLCAIKFTFKEKGLLFLYLLILLMDSALMAARAGFLLQFFAFASSFSIVKYLVSDREIFRVNVKKIIILCLTVVLFFSFFLLIQILRGGKVDFNVLAISSHILTWFVGYLSAFDIWLVELYKFELTYGSRTFAGLFDFLGLNERAGGVYNPVIIGGGRESNVFTAFRGLIEDFTLPVALVLVTFLGALFSYLLGRLNYVTSPLYVLILICILYFFSWSFVINPFIYNSLIIAVSMFYFCFLLFFKLRREC